jgi:Beta-propeller repeat
LVYSTYLGGTADELGKSIAVDPAGNAYLAGDSFSTDFPTMNPIQPANGGGFDSFLAKLNPAGDALVYSTYLGGSDWDIDPMIDIDPRGNVYAEGFTFSSDFPTTAGAFQTALASPPDTYVAKVNATGNALLYSTYLGGSGYDESGGVVLDPVGNVYLGGLTSSSDFPVVNAFQPTFGGRILGRLCGEDRPRTGA